jgi:hypothetical protein
MTCVFGVEEWIGVNIVPIFEAKVIGLSGFAHPNQRFISTSNIMACDSKWLSGTMSVPKRPTFFISDATTLTSYLIIILA